MAKAPAPDDLVALQRAANAAHREATAEGYSPDAWQPWIEASVAVQQGITAHASTQGVNRYELEMAVKAAARQD